MSSPKIKKIVSLAVGVASLASLAGAAIANSSTATAEPQQMSGNELIGFGSDTLQDVTNAFAGFANGVAYTPLISSSGSGYAQLVSWDAFLPGTADPAANRDCIVPKRSFGSILRPFGSSDGKKILSRAIDGTNWYTGLPDSSSYISAANCSSKSVSGVANFARSSSSSYGASTAGALTRVPFAKDALTFAYSKPKNSSDSVCGVGGISACTNAVDTLTVEQLRNIYVNGFEVVGSTVVMPCGIVLGSGTYKDWTSKIGGSASSSTENTSTALCRSLTGNGAADRLPEHDGPALKKKADQLVSATSALCDGVAGGSAVSCNDVQFIVGFSASQWVARSNGVAAPAPGTGVSLGKITELSGGTTYTYASESGGTWSSSNTAYLNSTFGRTIYYFVASTDLDASTGSAAITAFFKTSAPTIWKTKRLNNVATITTGTSSAVAHGFTVGQTITISGLGTNTSLNGTFTITAKTNTTFSFASVGADIAEATEAGTATYTALVCTSTALSRIATFGFQPLSSGCGVPDAAGAAAANNEA